MTDYTKAFDDEVHTVLEKLELLCEPDDALKERVMVFDEPKKGMDKLIEAIFKLSHQDELPYFRLAHLKELSMVVMTRIKWIVFSNGWTKEYPKSVSFEKKDEVSEEKADAVPGPSSSKGGS